MEKELKKLSRRELVDIIYQMKRNEERMQEEISALEKALDEKRIRISNAGSIADAAADITKIFSTAQATADLYLNEITCKKTETEEECAKMLKETKEKVGAILSDVDNLKARYEADYKKWEQLQTEIKILEKMKNQKGGMNKMLKNMDINQLKGMM